MIVTPTAKKNIARSNETQYRQSPWASLKIKIKIEIVGA